MYYLQLLFSFQGRISRGSYWIAWAIYLAANILVSILGTKVLEGDTGGPVILLVWLIIAYSSVAVAAKRWHDRDKSGWWSLIILIPIAGLFWMIVENGFLPGTFGPNRFGADPVKAVPITYEGQTYLRQRNGSFTDLAGNPLRDAVLIGALGTAYLTMQPDRSSTWDNSALDRLDNNDSDSRSDVAFDSDSGGGGGD
jgi:uncharacterized membrane protein YhaH (DUF805 family)